MIRRRTLLQRSAIACGASAAAFWRAGHAQSGPAASIRVAAAADLQFALDSVARQFEAETGQSVSLSFGSSGNFGQQISRGLRVDLFMSADEAIVRTLARAGLTRVLGATSATGPTRHDEGELYAIGRIALLLAKSSIITADPALAGLKAGWPGVSKFALANPEHAPYGRAAQQALVRLGLWELVSRKLVLGDNVAQATQFVTSGAAQAGITALSLALAPEVARSTSHVALPADLHGPLRQRMVLLKSASPAAVMFYDYLQTPASRTRLAHYGFSAP